MGLRLALLVDTTVLVQHGYLDEQVSCAVRNESSQR